MPIFISQDLWLSGTLDDGYVNANNPRIGYHNLVPYGGVIAESENPLFPASNIANVSTAEWWESLSDEEQHIEFNLEGLAAWNYFGIAGHNLAGAIYQMQSRADPMDDWEDVTEEFSPGDNNAIMHLFESVITPYARLKLIPAQGILPKIAVVYIGEYLTLPARVSAGHKPINLNRTTDVMSGMSERGDFLGRVLKKTTLGKTDLAQSHVNPDYYRTLIDPFVVHAQTKPFFVAWRPADYPNEAAFAWTTTDIEPEIAGARGKMNFTISMQAIAPWPEETASSESASS
jgi:hypothetical protein